MGDEFGGKKRAGKRNMWERGRKAVGSKWEQT